MSDAAHDEESTGPSNPPPSKKGRVEATLGIRELVERLFRTGHTMLVGKEKLIAWIHEEPDNAYKLAVSTVCMDVATFKTKVMPAIRLEGPDPVCERDLNFNVTAISVNSERIVGFPVHRLMCVEGAVRSGKEKIIFTAKSNDADQSALVVPRSNLENWTKPMKRNGLSIGPIKGRRVILEKSTVTLTLPPDDVYLLLDLEQLKLIQLPRLLRAVSNLREKDTEYEIGHLDSLEAVMTAMAESKVYKAQSAFLETLQASLLEAVGVEEKIKAFARNPTFAFFARLDFMRPQSKKLLTPQKAPVEPRALSDLNPGDKVILSPLRYDKGFYETISAATLVYVEGEYLMRRGKKNFDKYKAAGTMSANQIFQIITARDAARAAVGGGHAEVDPDPAAVVVMDEDGPADVELDI